MLVMPFTRFKQQGRIFKSVSAWRTEAFCKGWLVEYARVTGGTGKLKEDGKLDGTLEVAVNKTAIFISHTVCRHLHLAHNLSPTPHKRMIVMVHCGTRCCRSGGIARSWTRQTIQTIRMHSDQPSETTSGQP